MSHFAHPEIRTTNTPLRTSPPFQNNAVEETEESDNVDEISSVLLTDTKLSASHLTQQEYEDSSISN